LTSLHYRGNVLIVAIALSKLTAQGQISVPAEVRRKLGLGPGSVLEWCERGDEIVVRRAGRFSSADIHSALFSAKPLAQRKSADDLKQGIRELIRKKHAGR
jgi:antitoxin PrlF